jgi:hypothetical protein
MTREEHLDWCKKRAMEYVETGDLLNAVGSMLSDLGLHPETKPLVGLLGVKAKLHKEKQRVVGFIQGFN